MADIFVYAPNCDDFDNLGECGPLGCTNAKFVEEANGASELTIEHPIDEMGKWSYLLEGYILQAEVPVRTVPEIKDGAIVTQTQTWTLKSIATKGQRGMYSKPSGGKRLSTLDIWADKAKTIKKTYIVVKEEDTRYKVRRNKGYGYVSKDAMESGLSNLPLDQTPEAIETVVPAWSIKPQLFRMYAPVIDEEKVVVKARHISYDLLGNITTYDPIRTHPNWSSLTGYLVGDIVFSGSTKQIYFCKKDNLNKNPASNPDYWSLNPTCGAALAGILRNCAKAHEFEGFTNIADERVIPEWVDVSPIEALLGVDSGIVPLWSGDLVRDNWELTILNDAGLNRGVRIDYGKNLVGVTVSLDTSDLITAIRPIGQTNKGKPLYLPVGSYDVDGQHVDVYPSLTVNSPHESEYPVPHIFVMDLGAAAKSSGTNNSATYLKMVKACLDKFRLEQCDLPLLSMKVEFISLDSTEEYAQYKQLERVYLFDRVTVWHPKIGVDVLTSVKRIEFDPVKETFTSIEVGPIRRDATRKKLPSWKLPPAQDVAYSAVRVGALAEDVGALIELGANPTIDLAVTRATIESSVGNVIKGQSTSAGGRLTAKVYRGGYDITSALDPALFSWTRESGDATADAAWAAAHAGVTFVDVTAAEFAANPALYHCDVADPPEEE